MSDRVVICGAGVIGASIAYFLSRRNVELVVVERTGVANAASGKSGGFLALDWCRGTPVDALARRSFHLHEELAGTLGPELNLDWGYRRLDTLSVAASEKRDFRSLAQLGDAGLGWGSGGRTGTDRNGGDDRADPSGNVHPGHDHRGRSQRCAVDERCSGGGGID